MKGKSDGRNAGLRGGGLGVAELPGDAHRVGDGGLRAGRALGLPRAGDLCGPSQTRKREEQFPGGAFLFLFCGEGRRILYTQPTKKRMPLHFPPPLPGHWAFAYR